MSMPNSSNDNDGRKLDIRDLFDKGKHLDLEPKSGEWSAFNLTPYQCRCIWTTFHQEYGHDRTFEHSMEDFDSRDFTVYHIGWHTVAVFHSSGKCFLWDVSDRSEPPHKEKNRKKHKLFIKYVREEIERQMPPRTNKVFIVHGRDHRDRDYIAGMLYEWGLEPVILGFTPVDGSPNILTALKQLMSDIDFGIVIETPDDADGKLRDGVAENDFMSDIEDAITREQRTLAKMADSDLKKKRRKSMLKETMKKLDELIAAKHKAKKRLKGQQDSSYTARPNVLLELGMLIGMLGEDNVVRLRKRHENFVMPSDLEGAMRIEYDAIDRRDKMYSLWEKLVLRGFVVKRFDMAGRTQDSIVEKFHSRQEGVIMPGDKIGKNKAYF